MSYIFFFFFSSRRRHTRSLRDWSSDVCSSDLTLEDADQSELDAWTERMTAELRHLRELTDVATDQQPHGLAEKLVIDRATASRLNVTPNQIDSTLYDAFGQRQISTLYTQSNQYHVILEASPEFQKNTGTLQDIYVQSSSTQNGNSPSAPSPSRTSPNSINSPVSTLSSSSTSGVVPVQSAFSASASTSSL